MPYKVSFVNPQKQYADHKEEYLGVIDSCLSRGELLLRQELKDFEKHCADFIGVKYAVGVNSGHHALLCACIGSGFGPGDEVIVPAHTYMASISAIIQSGATAVLVDVKKDFNIDEDRIEEYITSKTKGIMPVHLNGRICDMEKIMAIAKKHNLKIVEDAAQSFGAKLRLSDGKWKNAASFGAGCLSYYPFKTLNNFADGGMVVSNDPEIARVAALLRWDGEDRETRDFLMFGYTASLSNVWAAVLDIKLTKYINSWLERRREIAKLYNEALKDIPQVKAPEFNDERFYDVFQNYVIRAEKRDELKKYFDDNQLVETIISWPKPTYAEPVMIESKDKKWRFSDPNATFLPETEKICKEVISLPMYPELSNQQTQYIIGCIKEFYEER